MQGDRVRILVENLNSSVTEPHHKRPMRTRNTVCVASNTVWVHSCLLELKKQRCFYTHSIGFFNPVRQ